MEERNDSTYGLFDKLRAAASKAAEGFKRLSKSIKSLTASPDPEAVEAMRKLPIPSIIKQQLPRTYFTKRHTKARVRDFREAAARLTPEQQAVCKAKGWIQ